MYSTDRSEPLEYTLACLRQMPLYEFCQKTLIVDGKIDKIPDDWQAVQVPRFDGKFCWGRMWDAGVLSAKFEKIIYLDSDRLLPKSFLQLIEKQLKENIFIFTSMHFAMQEVLSLSECQRILSYESIDAMITENSGSCLKYEIRHTEPFHGPGKNVMSGSTAFTKSTYLKLGGVDQWYCGHGAFADNDFHMHAASNGCQFLDLQVPELHFPHNKLNEDKKPMQDKDLFKLGLDNFIYYCHKWKLPNVLVESYAARAGIARPASYILKRSKEILG